MLCTFSPRARTRPPQRRAATAGPPPAPPEPSPDVPVPVPVPPAVLEHHLQAAQRIDQPTAAAAAAAALVAAPRRHPRRRQPPTAAPRRPRRCSPASRPPTAAPERPSAAAAAARTGRRGRTAAGDDAPAVGSGVGHRPSTWRQDPGFVGFRSAGHAPRRGTAPGIPAQGPRQRLQLAAPSAAAAGSPGRAVAARAASAARSGAVRRLAGLRSTGRPRRRGRGFPAAGLNRLRTARLQRFQS